ncbi:hypothetical protein [Nocardioides sp.]|uniref:hypothetical protein n=1 Tax=Nocardioides sp. TaxID=35761 RepID=UPI003526CF6C
MTAPSASVRRPARPASRIVRVAAALAVVAGVLSLVPTPAHAADTDEQTLAERYAPMVRLVPQAEACGPGEPYRPVSVDPLFDNPGVALRGPWAQDNLVEVGPSADDLSTSLDGYALDLPGTPLDPGCGYEEWFDRVWGDQPTTVYAHVATEEGRPDQLALEYWLYYPFNDFNNKHESDWETVQLEWDVGTVAEALETEPVTVLYSQHEAGEEAAWDDPKLKLDDGPTPRSSPPPDRTPTTTTRGCSCCARAARGWAATPRWTRRPA